MGWRQILGMGGKEKAVQNKGRTEAGAWAGAQWKTHPELDWLCQDTGVGAKPLGIGTDWIVALHFQPCSGAGAL